MFVIQLCILSSFFINPLKCDCTVPIFQKGNVTTNEPDINYWFNYSNVCSNAIKIPKQNSTYITYFGDFKTYQDCKNACISTYSTSKNKCQSFTYFTSLSNDTGNRLGCYGRLKDPQWCPCQDHML